MNHTDFCLRARDWADGRFLVEVTDSPTDRMRDPEPSSLDLKALALPLHKLAEQKIKLNELIALGEALARALFTPTVRELFVRSLDAVGAERGLRLRLLLDAPTLANLPWEYLFLARAGVGGEPGRDGFLVLDPRISLVRHEAIPALTPTVAAKLPLQMLMGLSSPADQAPLDLVKERDFITQALKAVSAIQTTYLENLSVAQLEAAQSAHLFHYAGHGAFREGEGGHLALTNAQDNTQLFAAENLALTLRRLGVRVAVLGACETAKRDSLKAWNSVAAALMKVGLGACVAMQYAVADESAIAFNQSFYRALAAGLSLDEAVSAGRISVLNANPADDADWGVPVLYLRAADGVVFPEVSGDSALEATRIAIRQEVTTLHDALLGADIETMKRGVLMVEQKTQVVETGGNMTGAQIKQLEGGQAEITQKVEEVKKGGKVTGVKLGKLG